MAQAMYKNDAMLHLVWLVATGNGAPGDENKVAPEENSYINRVRELEGINIDWEVFSAKRKELGFDRERIIQEACKALRGCGKDWRIKTVGYMHRMGWTAREDDPNNKLSDIEFNLILKVQKELGLTDEERKGSFEKLPSK